MSSTIEQMVANLVGQTVTRVSIEQWSVALLMEGSAVNIEGRWTLLDSAGVIVDSDCKDVERQDFKLWNVVGTTIVSSNITPDNKLNLLFKNGLQLEAQSDDDEFEDWQLSSKDGCILIVNNRTITKYGERSEVTIAGHGARIELIVQSYERENASIASDANWLSCSL